MYPLEQPLFKQRPKSSTDCTLVVLYVIFRLRDKVHMVFHLKKNVLKIIGNINIRSNV